MQRNCFLSIFLLLQLQSALLSTQIDPLSSVAAKESNEKFSLEFSANVGLENQQQNILISPILIQSALTLLYYASADDTAIALRNALHLQSFSNKQSAVLEMAKLLSSTRVNVAQKAQLANGLFAQERFMLSYQKEFIHSAHLLDIATDLLDFRTATKAVDKINYWFLMKTNYSIGDIITLNHLQIDSAQLLLASAIAFKAPWAKAFDAKATEKLYFHSDRNTHRLVDTMFIASKFKYAELDGLNAKVIELPYADDSGLKMLIFIPNQFDGLYTLEAKLLHEDLNALERQLSERKIALSIPKFHVEFNDDLKYPLTTLGLANIFISTAKFPNLFETMFSTISTTCVTHVQHKAVLEIDEKGNAYSDGFSFGDLFRRQIQLIIDHPFHFVIRNDEAILLSGHIVNI